MAKIHGMMDIGRRAMALNQTAIQTTSHNITNKSTEGYSRQTVDFSTNPSVGEGKFQIGTGARLANISRVNNPWIEKQLEAQSSNFSRLDQKTQSLARLEATMNEQSVKGINAAIGNFFNSFRELANTPESVVARTQVREAGLGLVKQFQEAHHQILNAQTDMNKQIEYSVAEVNALAKELAITNEKIQRTEIGGANTANDERDHRDALLKKLSEKIDISYAEDPKTGMINVTAGKAVILVTGTTSSQIKTGRAPSGETMILHELSPGGSQVDITERFKQGQVGAAIEVRDVTTQSMIDGLNELAFNIANEVNRAHREGYDRQNVVGGNFFGLNNPNDSFDVSNWTVSQDIVKDVSRIAAASKPNAPGDNSVANVIHSLQSQRFMDDGKYSFDDFYNAKVSEIGILAQRANSEFDSQKNTLEQLQNIRESISGVSLDEEAAKLIEYQKSYEASARLVKTADEMFDTILNLKRL
ncbi:flagellar hook-associated protein FlgK [Pseudobdellovibrio sp. HCB154]|uniref:flagellar hook-associated protein FlgK n=1 Tax=Pseudobdellovibrio sp. HCB154 TaxID=3386277 RepID=UPI00391705C5